MAVVVVLADNGMGEAMNLCALFSIISLCAGSPEIATSPDTGFGPDWFCNEIEKTAGPGDIVTFTVEPPAKGTRYMLWINTSDRTVHGVACEKIEKITIPEVWK